MGLGPLWKLRNPGAAANLPSSELWNELALDVSQCRLCKLCEQRKQAVLGIGDVHADWLFVGEGPGADEDMQGEPFVGQAGKLLDSMLAAIQLKRGSDVYIANAVKCRPPGNRTPTDEEMSSCRPYLLKQLALIKPRLIVALGGAAVGELAVPQDLRATAGDNDGELDGQCDAVLGASSYEWQTTGNPNDATTWVTRATTTRSSVTIAGLPSGARCWVRVRGIGAAGPGAWSDPAAKMVP